MNPVAVATEFAAVYGSAPDVVVRSPGRVNLIGDHTDYNDGFVMPFAIDRHIAIGGRARSDRRVVARSRGVAEDVAFDLSGFSRGGDGWGEYLKGVLHFFEYQGPGLDLLIDSNLPSGGGLSSSAALELGIARVISSVAGRGWDPVHAALVCQRAENEWVGTACGIMDQLVVACATADDVLEIDCRTLHFVPRRLPGEAVVVVLDTRTRRRLVSSAYRDRRQACDRAAAAYGVAALRDVTPHEVETRPETLASDDWARARHVVAENGRVRDAADALESGDLASVGRLMAASHRSLRDLFSVSTPELDLMVELASRQPGCLGARMTGAGFGGCVVALFGAGGVADAIAEIATGYRARTGVEPDSFVCRPSAGVAVVGADVQTG
jgi:galactokinase